MFSHLRIAGSRMTHVHWSTNPGCGVPLMLYTLEIGHFVVNKKIVIVFDHSNLLILNKLTSYLFSLRVSNLVASSFISRFLLLLNSN